MKHPQIPGSAICPGIALTVLLLSAVAGASAQPVMFHPGNTYEDIGAAAGGTSPCRTNQTAPLACVHSFNTLGNALSAAVSSDGIIGLPPERSNASLTVSVYKDFRVSPPPGGGEADLINSQISANFRWAGTLIGNGGRGTAAYRIEFVVIDRTDPAHPAVAYERVDERSETGAFKFMLVKGVPLVLPTPGFDLIQLEDLRTVLPVPLKRGRTYRMRLTLTISSLGGAASGAIADFFQPLPGMPDPGVFWDDLNVTVGVDMLSMIHDLQARVDTLAQRQDVLENQVDDHALAIADIEAVNQGQQEAIEENDSRARSAESAAGRNFTRISGSEGTIRDHEERLDEHTGRIDAITGSEDFHQRVDSLDQRLTEVAHQVAANAASLGDSSRTRDLWDEVLAHAEALDTLAFDVRSWTSVIETNTTAIVQNAASVAMSADSTSMLGHRVSCHVHADVGNGRTGLPDFATDCSAEAEEGKSVAAASPNELPDAYALDANYPNPFNPSTTIGYAVPKATDVRLSIYDLQGREVAELVTATQAAGRYEVTWDASGIASGVYLYRIQAGTFVATRSLVLVK